MALTFRIEMLPARHGDCLLISYGPAEAPYYILIDGGPEASYPELRARLLAISQERRRLQLLVVSHIDHDHIGGAVRLLGDQALGLAYTDLWFNGWKQLAQPLLGWRSADQLVAQRGAQRSALEAHHLALRIRDAGHDANGTFGGRALCLDAAADPPAVELEGGMRLTLLSPDVPALEKLRSHWQREMTRAGSHPDDAAAVQRRLDADPRYRGKSNVPLSAGMVSDMAEMGTKLDHAVANGSSIAFIAEFAGKRCAFLADAHMPLIEASVQRVAKRYGEDRLRLDAVKVAHHGSSANTTARFMQLVDCSRYLISTDGSIFGHPDDGAMACIVKHARVPAELHFNYHSDRTARWADEELQRSLGYICFYPATSGEALAVDLIPAG